MTREEIKDVILEIIADIDEEADFAELDADAPALDAATSWFARRGIHQLAAAV